MNGLEVMQVMLDGKTVIDAHDFLFRISKKTANLEFARQLREQAALHGQLAKGLEKGAYLESVAASEKAWKKSGI